MSTWIAHHIANLNATPCTGRNHPETIHHHDRLGNAHQMHAPGSDDLVGALAACEACEVQAPRYLRAVDVADYWWNDLDPDDRIRIADRENERAEHDTPPDEVPEPTRPERTPRLLSCIEQWPECATGEYNPQCCRFPKSCSCTVYDEPIDPALVEQPAGPMPPIHDLETLGRGDGTPVLLDPETLQPMDDAERVVASHAMGEFCRCGHERRYHMLILDRPCSMQGGCERGCVTFQPTAKATR